MNEVIFRYVQEKAMQDLREIQYLAEYVSDELNSGKWLEHLRKHIVRNDKSCLFEIDQDDYVKVMLFCRL